MGWIYLLIAAIFEVGWPLSLKMADISSWRILWIIFAIITITLSGYFLFLAQKTIPLGTAYAIWTGVGMIGAFILGIALFNDTLSLIRFIGVFLIFSGVIILKIF